MITIVGLGPGSPDQLTQEAARVLAEAKTLVLRTARHPAVAAIQRSFESFDDAYDNAESFDALYDGIAERIVGRGDVVYAVPGHPLVAERTVQRIRALAADRGIPVRIVAGLSFVEPALAAVGVDPVEAGLQVADAHAPDVEPFRPALIAQLYDRRTASAAKLALLDRYPADSPATIIWHAGLPDERTETVPLYAIDRRDDLDHLTCLYLPALPILDGGGTSRTFAEVVRRLRRECPWDREQTHASLRRYLIEETYEAADAIDAGDLDHLAEELGDVLLQVYLHAAIGEEAETFSLADVYRTITAKMIRRHPHVFGEAQAESAAQVEANWETIKQAERGSAPPAIGGGAPSVFDGIPKALPALAYVQEIQKRAKKQGFEWPTPADLWAKVDEELAELRAPDADIAWEIGDLLFVLVDVARLHNLQAEDVLRAAAARFQRRFAYIEDTARAAGQPVSAYTIDDLLALWRQSKPFA